MVKINAFAFMMLLLLFSSCNGRKAEEPRDVAEKFLKAVCSNRYAEAKKYSTRRTDKLLEVMSSVASLAPNGGKTRYKIVGQSVEGQKAWVKYTLGDNRNTETLMLVYKGNHWLVGTAD